MHRRFVKWTSFSAATVIVWGYVVPTILDLQGEKLNKNQRDSQDVLLNKKNTKSVTATEAVDNPSLSSKAAEDQKADSIFIPLGFSRERPSEPYDRSSPEWKAYETFISDPERSIAVRHELAGIVAEALLEEPMMRKKLGDPIALSTWWLEVDMPSTPPPQFERSGIEITEEYIAWSTRPVSELNVSRLRQALWPESMSLAFLAGYHVLFWHHFNTLKSILGFSNARDSFDPQQRKKILTKVQSRQSNLLEGQPGPDSASSSDTSEASSSANKEGPSPPSSKIVKVNAAAKYGLPLVWLLVDIPERRSAYRAFLHTLMSTWRSPMINPPRGNVIISGLIKFRGPLGESIVDVSGAYNPQDPRWTGVTIQVRKISEFAKLSNSVV
ncbi:MAG: hypothetical protein M1825_000671 [Sarcosagium campestre]|nr:MAG: hypothetical protein M1825_000671 [Sarcosagium campestre]